MSSRWTSKEIDTIKSGFQAGKLIKVIAEEVGRTPTAVNKFLSRAGIRTRRWKINKANVAIKKTKDYSANNQTLNAVFTNEIITDFQEIIRYLRQNGYTITPIDKKIFYPFANYAIDDKPVSDIKLLILANRIRCEKRQPIFAVPELSWD